MYKWLGLLGLMLLLAGCHTLDVQDTTSTVTQSTVSTAPEPIKTAIPTVFFHGYSGGKNSFGGMLTRLTSLVGATKEATITVSATGELTQVGEVTDQQDDPMIQVIFEDNTSTQENQVDWITKVLASLKTQGVDTVNVVGHSMGGVSVFDYLMQPTQVTQPKVAKAIAIGAPFNEFLDTLATQTQAKLLADGPDQISPRYQAYQEQAARFPKETQVEIISGQLSATDLSDGTVPLSSSLAMIPLLTMQGVHVDSTIIMGKQAQHSALHENQHVDQLVADFLWKTN